MNINQERETLKKRLKDKGHRDAFVSAYTDQTIPFQIRAMREQQGRHWTQEELASRADMKQERISALENPNYGKYSLRILKQLAAAFDVALMVRFIPFSELAEWKLRLSSNSLEVPSFDQEDYFKEKAEDKFGEKLLQDYYSQDAIKQPSIQTAIILKFVDPHQKRTYGIDKETSSIIQNTIQEGGNESAVG